MCQIVHIFFCLLRDESSVYYLQTNHKHLKLEKLGAKWNGVLCSLLLDYIQNEQVKWLDFDCSIQDIDHFKKQDIELNIAFFLCEKSSEDPKFSDQGTVTRNTELCNKWIQTTEVIMNIPGVGALFSSPW